jgi:hypothetical protein
MEHVYCSRTHGTRCAAGPVIYGTYCSVGFVLHGALCTVGPIGLCYGTYSEGLVGISGHLHFSETDVGKDEKTGTMVKIRECTGQ